MLLLDSVVPEKFYPIEDVATIVGWSRRTIERWIERGLLQACIVEWQSDVRKRIYRGVRVQGCEIRRFVKEHLTNLRPGKPRFRLA